MSDTLRPTKFVLVDVKMEMVAGRYTFACPLRVLTRLKKNDLVLVKTRYGFAVGRFLNINNNTHSENIKYQWVLSKAPTLESYADWWGDIDFNNRKFTNKKD